jgi:hypothetical protein
LRGFCAIYLGYDGTTTGSTYNGTLTLIGGSAVKIGEYLWFEHMLARMMEDHRRSEPFLMAKTQDF